MDQEKTSNERTYYVLGLLCFNGQRTAAIVQCTVRAWTPDKAAQKVRGHLSRKAPWVSAHVVGLATDQQRNSSRFTHIS